MSPTVPINHYFSPGNQRNRTFHANVFKHLPALNTNFFKGNLPNTLPTAIKSRQGLREEERPASIASWRTSQTTPKPNYELFNCNNFNIRYLPRLLVPDFPSNCSSLRGLDCSHSNRQTEKAQHCYLLSLPSRIGIGLLPSLDVVAVSQAPSPESSPNSPLPVTTMVGQYPTIES